MEEQEEDEAGLMADVWIIFSILKLYLLSLLQACSQFRKESREINQ